MVRAAQGTQNPYLRQRSLYLFGHSAQICMASLRDAHAGVLSRGTTCEQKERGVLMDSPFFLLARRKGLEPLTFWFVAKHSIQLS